MELEPTTTTTSEDYLYELSRIEQQQNALTYERQRVEQLHSHHKQPQQLGSSPSIYTQFSTNSIDSRFSYDEVVMPSIEDSMQQLPYQSISLSSSNSISQPNNHNNNNHNNLSPMKTYTQPSLPIIKQVRVIF